MVVKIGTLNCRGGISKIPHIIETVGKYKIDILYLQEIHKPQQIQINKLEMKTKMKCFASYGSDLARGVMILVRETEDVKYPILHSRDDDGNSVIVEAVIGEERFRLHNIYAPNAYGERTRLLTKHSESMETNYSIIYGGDYNCIQSFEHDCIGKSLKYYLSQKSDREVLQEMDDDHGYKDTFRVLHPVMKRFTFSGIGSYRARLDRIYIHETNTWRLQTANVYPVSFSDHDLYMVELKTQQNEDRPVWGRGLWKVNASLLEDTEIRTTITRCWHEWREQKHNFADQLQWWEGGKRFLKHNLMNIGREVKKKTNIRKKEISAELCQVTNSIHLDSATEIRKLKAALLEIEQKELEGAAVRSRNEWASGGEKATKQFFSLEKKNGKNKTIRELENEGRVLSGKAEILDHVKNHFENHFQATSIDSHARDYLIGTIKNRLTDDQSSGLGQPFTMDELEAAHKRMKKGRAPGNDGLSVDFYKIMWKLIREDLLDTLNEVLIGKELPVSMTQSVISLIFKEKGSRLHLSNYRAISLLNVDFKYLASIINARITPFLTSLVEKDQGGGIKSRLLEDQLIVIQNICDHYKNRSSRALIEAKDLKAAFDLCSHDYLFRVLKAMNFNDALLDLMKAIYGNLYTAVTINGTKTKYFRLTRSIRQGDPSSVTWFILAMEPLGNLIRASRRLHPILIPNQPPKRVNMFVDDTTIFSTDPGDHKAIQRLTSVYESGSGARFNETKSEILLLGRWPDKEKRKLPSNNVKDNIKLLGVWFGPEASKLNQAAILCKVDETINFWKGINLSFQGKKVIIETKILSQVLHIARITGMNKTLQKELQKRVTNFFWHPRRMALISMATLQNDTADGGLKLPNFATLNQAILVERFPKALRHDRPWAGQLLYRNGNTLRELEPKIPAKDLIHTTKQTSVSNTISVTYNELKKQVIDWSDENLKSLQQKLYKKTEVKLRADRDFSDTWLQISKATTHRKCRDLCFLVAHDSLPLNAMLKRRNVTNSDTCSLCGLMPETIRHVFLNCDKVQRFKMMLEKWVEPVMSRTLTEEEILYHEGRTKWKKKANNLIAQYKYSIWISRAKLYYGEIKRDNLTDDMIYTMKNHISK